MPTLYFGEGIIGKTHLVRISNQVLSVDTAQCPQILNPCPGATALALSNFSVCKSPTDGLGAILGSVLTVRSWPNLAVARVL
jgi:hypothetical protein